MNEYNTLVLQILEQCKDGEWHTQTDIAKALKYKLLTIDKHSILCTAYGFMERKTTSKGVKQVRLRDIRHEHTMYDTCEDYARLCYEEGYKEGYDEGCATKHK